MGRMRLAPDFNPTKKRTCQVGRRRSTPPPRTKRKYKAARPGPVRFSKKLSAGDLAENVRLSDQMLSASARRKLTQAEMKDGLLRSVLVASIPGVTSRPLSPRPSHTNQKHMCNDGEVAPRDACPFERFECRSVPAPHTQSLWSTPKCSPLSTHAWSPPKAQARKKRALTSALASPRCNLTAALTAAGAAGCWDPAQSTVTTPTPGAMPRMPLAPASAGEGTPPARALWHQNAAIHA